MKKDQGVAEGRSQPAHLTQGGQPMGERTSMQRDSRIVEGRETHGESRPITKGPGKQKKDKEGERRICAQRDEISYSCEKR